MKIVPLSKRKEAAPYATPAESGDALRLTGVTRAGLAVIFVFFGAFGGWAALAPLDSAAVAHGVIKVVGERKLVQHLEGGIVAQLKVSDGDVVEAGDVLIRLDGTQAKAQLDLLRNRTFAKRALAARLEAERDGASDIAFPPEFAGEGAPAAARDAMKAQRDVFHARSRALQDETEMLEQRIRQTEAEIEGLKQLIAIEDQQVNAIDAEASVLESLTKKGLTTRERERALRREQLQRQGDRATHVAAVASARNALAELRQKILNLTTVRLNEAVEELSKVESDLFDLEQQRRAADDVARRTAIAAPVAGIVMGLQVHTTGGVIRAGETLMTIVPLDQQLVVEAMIRPEDIETVAVGQSAHIRFSALSRYNLPPVEGVVEVVSADRLIDERTGAPYFTANVLIGEGEIAKLGGRKLLPGMTSEVMIRTGSRTMLAYLAEPLSRNLRVALREK